MSEGLSGVFSIPDELELLEFFCADPVERSVEDGYWCYEVTDRRGVRLRLSFNLFERSVQTALQVMDSPLITVSHEGAESMTVAGQTMTCRFSYKGSDARLVLRLGDSIQLDWSSLRKE
ncbi:hypothetical protein D7W82_38085 [Corallococcus sp. CA049B]|uniref:hypothetical protein n=1 Tax=Corallococcus sp. CA049B TaxID=2316730 RepID=UPI000EA2037E|nr:hypothetical protein [Corallococcus sp. CA049B]RKG74378.1 hypothetical protein D7W82_38085 [Corallococcus sp. CA049B]